MQFLVLLSHPFLWIISILPFRIFYWLSDGVYFLVYYIIGYRKSGKKNLALALPHLSDKERVVIEKNHTAIYVTCLWK
jgi:KDO2-lipid IV(A) lauroyltransferase